ncbi:MAG TPA: tRNA glutamyl-Q(34) synthetase GluQRS [Gammaproteobacteria bacterium]|nr:tRNA glutamyl-Q(34) synthetase GluQRS [Gammaproteobacteria bacterium]
MQTPASYRGRFAPSPTGPLHFGSLVAAVGSYLDARHHQGEWLLRVEDLDTPREVAGATDDILRTLELLHMTWDGPVIYQSKRTHLYKEALAELQQQGYLYDCGCTRKEVADSAIHTPAGAIYPGTCRNGLPAGRSPRSIRVRVNNTAISMQDRLQAGLLQQLQTDTGDFIVRRADQLIAYQLAVVVDDADQGINQVVRGSDLLASTPRQIYLQQLLNLPTPAYLHLPIATDASNAKLSKQSFAPPITVDDSNRAVLDVLRFLHQALPDSPQDASLDEIWTWAANHWDTSAIPAYQVLPAPVQYTESVSRS